MWKYPWRYSEGIVIVGGLIFTGIVLQSLLGSIDFENLKFPLNLIFGGILIFLIVIFSLLSKKNKYINWFSGYEASLTALLGILGLVVIMGLTKQIPDNVHLHPNKLHISAGFSQMTRSWTFALPFVYFLFLLGLVILRKGFNFHQKNIFFLLNHLGLFIALFAGIFGSSDLEKYRMQTHIGQTEWRGTDDKQQLVEVPIAIELKSFNIEEYPPKILMIDNQKGEAQPVDRPQNLLIENDSVKGKLLDWNIQIITYLPMAAPVFSETTSKYVEFQTHGATSAVYLKANKKDTIVEGWVSMGNHMFPHKALELNKKYSLVIPQREPKKYTSDVRIYSKSGKQVDTVIEVNKPYSIDGWKIYQVSYDDAMGRWSSTSVFELVKDPWLPFVYIGIFMMLSGALGLFLFAKPSEKNKL